MKARLQFTAVVFSLLLSACGGSSGADSNSGSSGDGGDGGDSSGITPLLEDTNPTLSSASYDGENTELAHNTLVQASIIYDEEIDYDEPDHHYYLYTAPASGYISVILHSEFLQGSSGDIALEVVEYNAQPAGDLSFEWSGNQVIIFPVSAGLTYRIAIYPNVTYEDEDDDSYDEGQVDYQLTLSDVSRHLLDMSSTEHLALVFSDIMITDCDDDSHPMSLGYDYAPFVIELDAGHFVGDHWGYWQMPDPQSVSQSGNLIQLSADYRVYMNELFTIDNTLTAQINLSDNRFTGVSDSTANISYNGNVISSECQSYHYDGEVFWLL